MSGLELTRKNPSEDQESNIPTPIHGRVDVCKSKLVNTTVGIKTIYVDRCEGKKDNPGYEPDGQHDTNHHAQETDEEIAIEPIDILNLAIVGRKDGARPSPESRG